MSWAVITGADKGEWRAALARIAQQDIYHQLGYHLPYENRGARACAFVAKIGGEVLFHPVLVRKIDVVGAHPAPEGLYDAESIYGYSGPIATTRDAAFLAEAWRGYEDWCREEGVVGEFVRFNPLLENQELASPGTKVWRDRQTVVMELSRGMDQVWSGYKDVHRNAVRKARKSGLTCAEIAVHEGLASFRSLYDDTMDALDAAPFYRFSSAYFDALIHGLGEDCRLFLVHADGKPIAGALFLLHGTTIHYHLAGTSRHHRHLAPNNLLIDEVARWAAAHGYRQFHLGGGRTAAEDDGLFRFKARFSPSRCDQYFGRRIFDQASYDSLRSIWLDQFAGPDVPSYFQLYRLDPGRAPAEAAAS